jgi:cytochrome P450
MAGRTAVGAWDPFSKGYFDDPYPHLSKCRELAPVQQVFPDAYFLFRHHDINEILKRRGYTTVALSKYLEEKEEYIFKDPNACPFLSQTTQLWPMYLDGSIHRKVRKAITKAFHAPPVEKIIETSLTKLFAEFNDLQEFDLVDFCGKFIYHFINDVLSLQDTDYASTKSFSNLLAISQDLYVPKQKYKAINEGIAENLNVFGDSVFRDALKAELQSEEISAEMEYSLLSISLMASFETSKDNLSLALHSIMSNPDATNLVLDQAANNLKAVIEESFRFSSPLQYTVRITPEDLEIGDTKIAAKSKLYLCLASGNRDSEVFHNPDYFLVNRQEQNHLAFGAGPHTCLGASIARKEMEICLRPMVEFLKDSKLGEPKFARQIFMRTAKSIPVIKN